MYKITDCKSKLGIVYLYIFVVHHLRKTFYISFIMLILSNISIGYGQICGQFIEKFNDKFLEIPLIKVSFELNENNFERSDVNGEFELKISPEKCFSDLYFETLNGLIVRIKDVPIKPYKQLNLGQITMPDFKYISIDEYNKLTREQKKECIPDRHYWDIYGYSYSNELEDEYLILKCVKSDKKIKDFSFDPKSKTITLTWNVFNSCK